MRLFLMAFAAIESLYDMTVNTHIKFPLCSFTSGIKFTLQQWE